MAGDGPGNDGIASEEARDLAVRAGITVNGLPLVLPRASINNVDHEERSVERHYRRRVIGGQGAFLLVVNDPTDFEVTLLRKLTREIAQIPHGEKEDAGRS